VKRSMNMYPFFGRERQGASSLAVSNEKWHEDCLITSIPRGKLILCQA